MWGRGCGKEHIEDKCKCLNAAFKWIRHHTPHPSSHTLHSHTHTTNRAQAFNSLVFGEIGYVLTTRFIKMSTFHPRVFFGNPLCFGSMLLSAALQVCVGQEVWSGNRCVGRS